MTLNNEKLINQLGLKCANQTNKIERIKFIVDNFLNGKSTPDNLVREINEACDAINNIKDILEE